MNELKSPCANCGSDIVWFPVPGTTQTCEPCGTSFTRDQILEMWMNACVSRFDNVASTLGITHDDLYFYKAEIVRVIDGDTFEAAIDLGFHVTVNETFRLARIDTPEPTWRAENSAERVHGELASQVVRMFTDQRKEVVLITRKSGKYGRWIADVLIGGDRQNPVTLVDLLLELGLDKRESYAAYAGETYTL